MGTRATVIARIDGRYHRIYVGHDGMPDSLGDTLDRHYTDPAKIAAMIALGDLSSLGSKLENGGRDGTNAYHRDGGEDMSDVKAAVHDSLEDAAANPEEYTYLWDDTLPPTEEDEATALLREARAAIEVFSNQGYGQPGTPNLLQRIDAALPPSPPHPRWHVDSDNGHGWITIPEAIAGDHG